MASKSIFLGVLLSASLLPASLYAAPVVISGPVTPPLTSEGNGLCAATAVSTVPGTDFGTLGVANYNGNLNTFMEAHIMDRVEGTVRTLLDLSNNNATGLKLSYGDFTNSMLPTCLEGGCDFLLPAGADPITASFATRLRGFFNVTADLVGKSVHIGFYTDDAVSLTFFDKNNKGYPILIRPPQLGFPTWRTTGEVNFTEAGLYPVEVLYVEIGEHAALEMSYFIGPFTDFELPANAMGSTSLQTSAFTIFPPSQFFQTLSGAAPFPDINQCKQCDRAFVNLPGTNGCLPGYYCNEAAVCSPCDSALLCGATCSPCGGATPFCINKNGTLECGGCRDDNDCPMGKKCIDNTCEECADDSDCPRGKACIDHKCDWCFDSSGCAGNSCNCCPPNEYGRLMKCVALGQDEPPVCIECQSDAECENGGICDLTIGHCVPELNKNQTKTCCGPECSICPDDFPFCLPGPLGTACAQCASDMDCKDGDFCLSGICTACTRDRHCGLRCETCFGDTPYCLGNQIADNASCVRCITDEHCKVGACNPNTHQCESQCMMSCDPATPFCDAEKCVECYADTQCPCGGTCDLSTNTCTPSCKTNIDCLGNEHCRYTENAEAKECALGPMPGDVACGGTLGTACDSSIGNKSKEDPPPAGLVGLAMMALLLRRRMRGRS